MSKQAYRSFRYAGSKKHLISYVNSILSTIDTTQYVYIEPFLGSGMIYYNLKNDFKDVILNDIDKNIIDLHNCFKQPYELYDKSLAFVDFNFGNIRTDKRAYYALRKYYNENPYDKYLLLQLANSCINSMLRFGPNGMNQSFGHRHYRVSEDTWKHLRQKILQANLYNKDYLEILDSNATNSCIIFLDPPYEERTMPYSLTSYSRRQLVDKILELTQYNDTIILYTDIENTVSDKLLQNSFKKICTKLLRTTCPSKSSERTNDEYLYCNIL